MKQFVLSSAPVLTTMLGAGPNGKVWLSHCTPVSLLMRCLPMHACCYSRRCAVLLRRLTGGCGAVFHRAARGGAAVIAGARH
jgi:hypothetical protein